MAISKRQVMIDTIKMHDIGRKESNDYPLCSSKSSKSRIYYPTLYLSGKQTEGLGDAKVGSTLKLVIEAVIKSKNSYLSSDGKTNNDSTDLEVRKIGISN